MPGIAGFISNSKESPSTIDTMIRTMLHEPSYTSGTLSVERFGLSAGWVCHGNSYSDCLPIWIETKDVCLLFVGQNFFDESDAHDLRSRGHVFDRHDATSLVHLYEENSDSFFSKLNGVFAGLLIDFRRGKVILFNDRYGLGRIYYHQTKNGFYFASEAKALLKVLPHLRKLDPRSLGEYFACGCVLQDRALFEGVALLPSGSAWVFGSGEVLQKNTYFERKTWETQPSLSTEDYYAKLKTTFARVLPRYFADDERVAMSLTGGLDSRMIMAWANGQSSKLTCYSHLGIINKCADARIGRRVADECGRPHHLIQVGEKFFSEFPTLALRTAYITDGMMDMTGSPGLYANRVARDLAPVRMTGNYGGEILRGQIMLRPAKLRHPYFAPEFAMQVADGYKTLAEERRGSQNSFIAFKQVPWHHYSRFALEASQWTVRSPYLDNELVGLAYQAPADVRENQRLAERLIADGNPTLVRFPTDRGPLGRPGFLGRLGEMYQEFTFKADYAYDYGMPHWLTNVDRVFGPLHLERLFLGRHKYYHFRYWYRTQLAPFVRDILLDSRTLARPYLDRNSIRNMVEAHVAGRGNYTIEITSLLSTELMQRQLIDGI